MHLILAILFLASSEPTLDIQYQEGTALEIPSSFNPVESLDKIEIGKSYWLRIEIVNPVKDNFILVGGNPYMKSMIFYDRNLTPLDSGNYTEIDLKKGNSTYFIFYPFGDGKDADHFSVQLMSEQEFFQKRIDSNIEQSVFLSVLIFLTVISLVFGIVSKDAVYYIYAAYLLSMVSFFGYQYGFLGHVLPIVKEIPPLAYWLSGFLITFFYVWFSMLFLDLKNRDPWTYKLGIAGLGYMLLLSTISTSSYMAGIDIQHNIIYKSLLISIELILILIYLYRVIRLPGKLKNFFLASSVILLVISIGSQIHSTIKLVDDFNTIAEAGILIEVLILSSGLGVRVYEIQKSRNKVQEELITQLQVNQRFQEKYAEELEKTVNERTETITQKSEENELLLKEIHHRVKNNLQMITSMLSLQQRRASMDEVKNQLDSTKNKIKSIALIHEHLYSTDNLSQLKVDDYAISLVNMLLKSNKGENHVDFDYQIEDLYFDFEDTIEMGLILNELITNSIKYALFDHPAPRLFLSISLLQGQKYTILLKDNGNGKPEDVNNSGLGMLIINSILAKEEGSIKFYNEKDWFCVKITM